MDTAILFNIINLIEANIPNLPIRNDLKNIESFVSYFASRCSEKIITMCILLVKHMVLESKVSISEFKNRENKTQLFQSCEKEASITSAALLQRNMMEMYADLLLLEAQTNKEEACKQLIWHDFIEERKKILDNIKVFYETESPGYKKFSEDSRLYYNNSSLSPFNQNFKKKLKAAFEIAQPLDILILGGDYFNLYSFLSKKKHFGSRNSIHDQADPLLYAIWTSLFIVKNTVKIFELMGISPGIYDDIKQTLSIQYERFGGLSDLAIKVGSYVRTEFGLGIVIAISVSPKRRPLISIEYFESDYLGTGFQDVIPAPLVTMYTDEQVAEFFDKYNLSSVASTLAEAIPKTEIETRKAIVAELWGAQTFNAYGK